MVYSFNEEDDDVHTNDRLGYIGASQVSDFNSPIWHRRAGLFGA